MKLLERTLKAGEDDWIYLAEIVSHVDEYVGMDLPEPVIRSIVLTLVRYVVEKGWFEIGDIMGDSGFQKWDMSLDQAMGVLEREWKALGRPISISDVCWLCLTEAGHAVARTIPDEPDPF